jgi:hypothetical protein
MKDRHYADKLEDAYNNGLPKEEQIHPQYDVDTPHFSDVDGEWLLASIHEWFLLNYTLGRLQWQELIRDVYNRQPQQ